MKTGTWFGMFGAASTIALAVGAGQPEDYTQGLPAYQKSEAKLAGSIRCAGSTTVGALMSAWGDSFEALYPGVKLDVTTGGSAAAPAALIDGKADLAAMSRDMTDEEIGRFRAKYGYEPTRITVAVDALAVFVNKSNPIEQLSFQQLDSIYSSTNKRAGKPADSWGGVGMSGDWAPRPITIYGFAESAGGHALFKELVLDGGEFRGSVDVEPGSNGIVNGVGADEAAIGYASVVFQTRRVRAVPLSAESGSAAVEPTRENCLSGRYPLARRLHVYINKKPGESASPAVKELLTFACSRDGQRIVAEDIGNYPLSPELAAEQLGRLSP